MLRFQAAVRKYIHSVRVPPSVIACIRVGKTPLQKALAVGDYDPSQVSVLVTKDVKGAHVVSPAHPTVLFSMVRALVLLETLQWKHNDVHLLVLNRDLYCAVKDVLEGLAWATVREPRFLGLSLRQYGQAVFESLSDESAVPCDSFHLLEDYSSANVATIHHAAPADWRYIN
jgi:hypothetical protein